MTELSRDFPVPRTYQGDVAECIDKDGRTVMILLQYVFRGGLPINTIHHDVHHGRLSSPSGCTPWIIADSEEALVEELVGLYDEYELG